MVENAHLASLFPGFQHCIFDIGDGVRIAATIGGSGPPLLLLHGHPQTRAIWHRVAPILARTHTLVIADLRGYGDSDKPYGERDHSSYSKRVMARDQLTLMSGLGFARFDVMAHDRGGRVAHRLAADHPDAIARLVLLDIAPTIAMYEQTSEAFARAYWHWFFLIQPEPLPERLITADTRAYVRDVMGNRSAGMAPFDARALAEYERCAALPGTAHGICEDYRAAASIDLVHDRSDRESGRMLEMPVQILWGKDGVVNRCFKPLEEWRRVARNVKGQTLDCGHYIAEEAPEALLAKVQPFLAQESL